MKLLTLCLALGICAASSANAAPTPKLIVQACTKTKNIKTGQDLIEQITVYSNEIVVRYLNLDGEVLGTDRGQILSSSAPTPPNGKITLQDLTLNDGADGYLDHMNLEITKSTVRFEPAGSTAKASKRIPCKK